jgi:hypothetical protein
MTLFDDFALGKHQSISTITINNIPCLKDHLQVVKSSLPADTCILGRGSINSSPYMVAKDSLYSFSNLSLNYYSNPYSSSKLFVSCQVPFIIAKTAVILVSQVSTGLIRDPLSPVPSSAPYLVCPAGE